jgi:hypothetical protein
MMAAVDGWRVSFLTVTSSFDNGASPCHYHRGHMRGRPVIGNDCQLDALKVRLICPVGTDRRLASMYIRGSVCMTWLWYGGRRLIMIALTLHKGMYEDIEPLGKFFPSMKTKFSSISLCSAFCGERVECVAFFWKLLEPSNTLYGIRGTCLSLHS